MHYIPPAGDTVIAIHVHLIPCALHPTYSWHGIHIPCNVYGGCRRYGSKLKQLRSIFSEYGLIRFRTLVECRWLQMLADLPEVGEVPAFDDATSQLLERFGTEFSVEDAQEVKNVSTLLQSK